MSVSSCGFSPLIQRKRLHWRGFVLTFQLKLFSRVFSERRVSDQTLLSENTRLWHFPVVLAPPHRYPRPTAAAVHVIEVEPKLWPCVLPGGAAALWNQSGEAQPLPGAAGAVAPEAAARGGSGRQGAHQEDAGQVPHAGREDQRNRLQGAGGAQLRRRVSAVGSTDQCKAKKKKGSYLCDVTKRPMFIAAAGFQAAKFDSLLHASPSCRWLQCSAELQRLSCVKWAAPHFLCVLCEPSDSFGSAQTCEVTHLSHVYLPARWSEDDGPCLLKAFSRTHQCLSDLFQMKKHMQDLSNKISGRGLQHNELWDAVEAPVNWVDCVLEWDLQQAEEETSLSDPLRVESGPSKRMNEQRWICVWVSIK